jgi:hypothetical protein
MKSDDHAVVRKIPRKLPTISWLLAFSLLAACEDTIEVTEVEDFVSKAEHEKLLAVQIKKHEELEKTLQAEREAGQDQLSPTEHEQQMVLQQANFKELQKELLAVQESAREQNEANLQRIAELEKQVVAISEQLKKCHAEGKQLKTSLSVLKASGSKEYLEILKKAKEVDNEMAILMYEEFMETFPENSTTKKAQGRLRWHLTQRKVLQSRENARSLQIWQAKLKAARITTIEATPPNLELAIGRSHDSISKDIRSEFSQITYIWRDYIRDLKGEYHDLILITIDGKVHKITSSEKKP